MKNLELIFEELSHIEYMVKESNSELNTDIVYEAFWDTVKKGVSAIRTGASKAGEFVGTGVKKVGQAIDYVKELGQKTWDKIVALGNDFVEWVKSVKAKIVSVLQAIKEMPAKGLEAMKTFFAWLAEQVNSILGKIKSGWDTFVEILNIFVFRPIAKMYASVITKIDSSIDLIQVGLVGFKDDIVSFAKEAKDKGAEKWNSLMNALYKFFVEIVPLGAEKVKNFLVKAGTYTLFFGIGAVILPFVLAFKGLEFVYKLGEKFIETISSFVSAKWEELKEFTARNWAEMKEVGSEISKVGSDIKTGYEKGKLATTERRVVSFQDFLKIK